MRRTSSRTGRIFAAALRSETLRTREIVVRNLSPWGLSARSKLTPPSVGEKVILTFEAFGDIDATVKWIRGERFGLSFEHELDPTLINFSPKATPGANKEFPVGHVYDQFKPVTRACRPGVKPPRG
jgi:hypothetical protein